VEEVDELEDEDEEDESLWCDAEPRDLMTTREFNSAFVSRFRSLGLK